MDASSNWERMLDEGHVRSRLVDTSAFQVCYSVLVSFCVGQIHGFLEPVGSSDEMSERDARLASCDPENPTRADFEDAIEFFVESDALTREDAAAISAFSSRQDAISGRAHTMLYSDDGNGLLEETFEMRDVLRRLSRWWLVEIEAAIQPGLQDTLDGVPSKGGSEVMLDLVLRIAQEAADPEGSV